MSTAPRRRPDEPAASHTTNPQPVLFRFLPESVVTLPDVDSVAIALADGGIILLAALGAVSWLLSPRADKLGYAVEGAVAAALAGVLALLTGLLWTDPRPFVVDHTTPLISHGVDNGFPSDHTALAFAVAAVVWRHDRRFGIPALVLAAAVGASRVYVGVHHWPDILGGAVVGLIAAAAAQVVAGRATPAIAHRLAPEGDG